MSMTNKQVAVKCLGELADRAQELQEKIRRCQDDLSEHGSKGINYAISAVENFVREIDFAYLARLQVNVAVEIATKD